MNRPRVIPCLLVRDGGLYKTERFENPVYVGDPLNAVRIFNDKEVDEIVVLDIGRPRSLQGPDFDLVSSLAAGCFMPLCYGGGVRGVSDSRRLFDLGVEKVAITSAAVESPELIAEAASIFGSQSVVVGIDVRRDGAKFSTMINAGTRPASVDLFSHVHAVESAGAGEIFLTSIDREGTRSGYDLELIGEVARAVGIPVIANGGAGSLRDCAEALAAGASAAAAGSLFVFHGKRRAVLISYPSEEERQRAFSSDGSVTPDDE